MKKRNPDQSVGVICGVLGAIVLMGLGTATQACTADFEGCVTPDRLLDRLGVVRDQPTPYFEQDRTEDTTLYSLALGFDNQDDPASGVLISIELLNPRAETSHLIDGSSVTTDVQSCDIQMGRIDFLAGPNGAVRDADFLVVQDGRPALKGTVVVAEVSNDAAMPPLGMDALIAAIGAEYCLCQGAEGGRD